LTGSVPDLQLDRLFIDFDSAKTKVYANGANVAFRKSVILFFFFNFFLKEKHMYTHSKISKSQCQRMMLSGWSKAQ
jgi:hypothetical protein